MRKPVFLLVSLSTVAMLTACSGTDAGVQGEDQPLAVVQSDPDGTELMGAGLARALSQATVRGWLLASIGRSKFVEGRLPLRRWMVADTSAELRQVMQRVGVPADLKTFARSLPDLEVYFPVPGHFDRAASGLPIQVAVRGARDSFSIYRGDGSVLRVDEWYDPGSVSTLVLGRSEIDYDDPSTALIGGSNTASALVGDVIQVNRMANAECNPDLIDCGPGGGSPPPPVGGDVSAHTQFNYVMLARDMEGLLMGLNEIEIFGKINGAYAACGSVTNVQWGIAYALYFNVGDISRRIATAVPTGAYRLTLEAYEDDDQRCERREGDDWLGNWNTGITRSQYGQYYFTDAPGLLQLRVGAVNQ